MPDWVLLCGIPFFGFLGWIAWMDHTSPVKRVLGVFMAGFGYPGFYVILSLIVDGKSYEEGVKNSDDCRFRRGKEA